MEEAGPARVISSDIRSVVCSCHGLLSSVRGREGRGLGRHEARATRDERGQRWASDTTDGSKACQGRHSDISDICPDTITGAASADQMTGNAGVDAFLTGAGGGVAATAAVAATSITFGGGVDVITDFVGGALAAGGETLTSGNTAFVFAADAIRGNFTAATGLFTANAAGADYLVATGAVADLAAANLPAITDNATVLLGTGATLVAANLA